MIIEKNIPRPVSKDKYPYKQMEVGDSVGINGANDARLFNQAARDWGRKNGGRSFSCLKVYDEEKFTHRIWRIK